MGVGGGWGVPPTYMHMHVHARMCTHAHAHMVNMIISCKWPTHWGNPWEFPMMSYMHDMHACACMCMCLGGTLSPSPTHTNPTPIPGLTPGVSQNSIALELIEIFQFRLKI